MARQGCREWARARDGRATPWGPRSWPGAAMDTEVRCPTRKPGAEGGPRMTRKGRAGHGWVLALPDREARPQGCGPGPDCRTRLGEPNN